MDSMDISPATVPDSVPAVVVVAANQVPEPVLPYWLSTIYKGHQGMTNCLQRIADGFRGGLNLDVSLPGYDERFRSFNKAEILATLVSADHSKDILFLNYRSAPDLNRLLREDCLCVDLVSVLTESRPIEIYFYHRNYNSAHQFMFDFAIVKLKIGLDIYYALFHRSKCHIPSECKINVVVTDSFATLFESVHHYSIGSAVVAYSELHKAINKEFVYRHYFDYCSRNNEVVHIVPTISRQIIPAVVPGIQNSDIVVMEPVVVPHPVPETQDSSPIDDEEFTTATQYFHDRGFVESQGSPPFDNEWVPESEPLDAEWS
ncbi:unnamed protein product [Rotaria socialis]|uniref:Uncharacterized protein n=1 Tax=Rotaria socialis TaxID=392032 RepID=A0A818QIB5_9BILA|nr:unnamed protein product [Rotaria socialis]CAF4825477.1 unnamed protein product [Rotaria socialis]